MRMFISVI